VNQLEYEALHQTIWRLEQRWVPPIPDASVWHAYDPLPWAEFMQGVRVAAEHAPRTFLDIGCGIGTKLAFMYALGWRVSGIDRHQPYIDAAQELVPEATLFCADIREVTELPYDVIYMYRPAVSEELEQEVERHVVSHLEPGTVVFAPHRDLAHLGLEPLEHDVWRMR
jgi:2-polyprenyl-3-methyl-5-hydroxy-6-metoxy-1,4-benzoquinol methylase